jgi:hypothetical protein
VELIKGTKVNDVALPQEALRGRRRAPWRRRTTDDRARQSGGRRCARRPQNPGGPGEAKQQSHAKIAKARFALEGTSNYPDATFTLRLAFGTVKGFEEGGKKIPAHTTFAGLYERAAEQENRPPFRSAERFGRREIENRSEDTRSTSSPPPTSSAATPAARRGSKGEFVGIIFDGNIQSLVLDFAYSDVQAAPFPSIRAALSSAQKVYGARTGQELSRERGNERFRWRANRLRA